LEIRQPQRRLEPTVELPSGLSFAEQAVHTVVVAAVCTAVVVTVHIGGVLAIHLTAMVVLELALASLHT